MCPAVFTICMHNLHVLFSTSYIFLAYLTGQCPVRRPVISRSSYLLRKGYFFVFSCHYVINFFSCLDPETMFQQKVFKFMPLGGFSLFHKKVQGYLQSHFLRYLFPGTHIKITLSCFTSCLRITTVLKI